MNEYLCSILVMVTKCYSFGMKNPNFLPLFDFCDEKKMKEICHDHLEGTTVFCVVRNIRELNFSQLMDVYSETNKSKASEDYAYLEEGRGILEAEQDHYAFLNAFIRLPGAFLALWASEGCYKAALRVEPYADGYLIEGLETVPNSRRRGYGARLLQETLKYLSTNKAERIYSHIDKDNIPSIRLHESCGFAKFLNHAVFVDGSVDHRTYTYIYVAKEQGAA